MQESRVLWHAAFPRIGHYAAMLLISCAACACSTGKGSGERARALDVQSGVDGSPVTKLNHTALNPECAKWDEAIGLEILTDNKAYMDLLAIQAIPTLKDEDFNPVQLIRSVNYFVERGKAACDAAVEQYGELCRLSKMSHYQQLALEEDRIILLGLLIYMSYGSPPAEPARDWITDHTIIPTSRIDRLLFPNFPLLVVDDIPFRVASGWVQNGCPPTALNWYQKVAHTANFRVNKLVPTREPRESSVTAIEEVSVHWHMFGGTASERSRLVQRLGRQAELCVPEGASTRETVLWSQMHQRFQLTK